MACLESSEDNFGKSALFHYVGFRDAMQVVRVGGKAVISELSLRPLQRHSILGYQENVGGGLCGMH